MVHFQAFELVSGSKISLSSNSFIYLPSLLKDLESIRNFLETTLSEALSEQLWFGERLSYLQLMENQKEDSHIERYLFNDFISRDICTMLGPLIPATKRQKVYKVPSHLPGLPMRNYVPLPPARSDIFPFGNAWTLQQTIGMWKCPSVSLALFEVLDPKSKIKMYLLHVYCDALDGGMMLDSISLVLDLIAKK